MKDPLAVFLALSTQWRWTSIGMAGAFRTGIDYAVLPVVTSSLDVKLTDKLFNDIRTLERGALDYWSAT